MKRRESIVLLGGVAGWLLVGRTQQLGKVWRIGMLETTSMELNSLNLDAFRRNLRDLGYVEGQNLIIEYSSVRFAELAASLLRSNVDVIVTRGAPAALAARKAMTTPS